VNLLPVFARHIVPNTALPPNPMSLPEAQHFIQALATQSMECMSESKRIIQEQE
jgi:hypothetical protein